MKISVKVIPNAKKDEVKLAGEKVEEGLIVKVHTPPEKNKANDKVVEILKDYFKTEVRIISGEKSRKKIVEIL